MRKCKSKLLVCPSVSTGYSAVLMMLKSTVSTLKVGAAKVFRQIIDTERLCINFIL
jgi:hypothetical protein